MLKTTTVGSFPKPEYLLQARGKHSRGEMSEEELKALTLRATEEVIRLQEEIGLDILVDGEMERGDMATFFAEGSEVVVTAEGLARVSRVSCENASESEPQSLHAL